MDRQKGLNLIEEMLEMPSGQLKGSERLQDLEQWDSLAIVSFMALADEHYEVTVKPQQILACQTVADLLELAESHSSELARPRA